MTGADLVEIAEHQFFVDAFISVLWEKQVFSRFNKRLFKPNYHLCLKLQAVCG